MRIIEILRRNYGDLGSDGWELIAFQKNVDKTITGIFKKVILSSDSESH